MISVEEFNESVTTCTCQMYVYYASFWPLHEQYELPVVFQSSYR